MTVETSRYSDTQLIFIPLSLEEKKKVGEALKEALKPIVTDYAQEIIRIRNTIAANDRKLAENTQKLAENAQKHAENAQKHAENAQKHAENARIIAEADRNIAEADRKIVEVRRTKMECLVKLFYKIFYGKEPVPAEQIDTLFSTYLGNGAISFDEGKDCFKLNSMKGVIRYLKEHLEVKHCDFRSFKREICEISTFAEYLKKSSITVVAFNSGISETSKACLNEAIAERRGKLKVQYFA